MFERHQRLAQQGAFRFTLSGPFGFIGPRDQRDQRVSVG